MENGRAPMTHARPTLTLRDVADLAGIQPAAAAQGVGVPAGVAAAAVTVTPPGAIPEGP